MNAPPLTLPFKLAFASGSMAEAIVYSTTASFLLLFYNQVLGVDAALAGLVIGAGIVFNAVFEPLIGSWSDRTRSRWGRRHPFMLVSILPITFSYFALFSPPAGLGQTGLLIWLGVCNFILAQAVTVFHTPHLALGGELSPDYTERSRVMSFNTFFLWMGDTMVWISSFAIFFAAAPGFPNGALNPANWPPYVAFTAGGVFATLMISTIFTRSRIPYLPPLEADCPRFSLIEMGRDIGRALSNRNFRALLIGYLFLTTTSGVRASLWIYGATYFWQLSNDKIAWFVIGSLISYVFGTAIVAPLHNRFEKRWTGAGAVLVYSIGPSIALILGVLGVLTPDTPGLLGILIALGLLQHLPWSLVTTTVYSAMSDIADENELRFGIRQEGVLYSTTTLFLKVDQAIGSAVAGVVLTAIAFPAKAVPGQVEQLVLDKFAIAFVGFALPGIIAAWFFSRMLITRASHDATAAALARRREPNTCDIFAGGEAVTVRITASAD
jgi:glycoside/pentoside/hexuronide:cation symporter, GPH family